jgi:SEC-C motif-containing protein
MQLAAAFLFEKSRTAGRLFGLLTTAGACVECANFNHIGTRRSTMDNCPCGSGIEYVQCCRPYIQGDENAPTAEALMRSRYCAYVKSEIDYIYHTTHPSKRSQFNHDESLEWSRKAEWKSLEILRTESGGVEDETGIVEFVALYHEKGKAVRHHEVAEFTKENGHWYFVDGQAPKPAQVVRQGPKIGRNDPCPCGSGRKFKKCCGS